MGVSVIMRAGRRTAWGFTKFTGLKPCDACLPLFSPAQGDESWRVGLQTCLPVKWMDLGYNLLRTHDADAAFLIVDHDEEDMVSARAPISNIYAPGLNRVLNIFTSSSC